MTDKKFTPGKWEVRIDQIVPTSKAECFTVVTDDFEIVSPMLGIRNEHDADLIAAAPELYEALECLLDDIVGRKAHIHDGSVEAARIVLAKAKGEK